MHFIMKNFKFLGLMLLFSLPLMTSCDFFLDADEGIVRTMKVQAKDDKKADSFVICKESYRLEFATVSLEMRKRIDERFEEPYYCSATIYVMKDEKIMDSIVYENMQPVGGDYGLRVHNELINGCLIITKHGDYDGETIFINPDGNIQRIIGGIPHLLESKNWIVSFYESDLGGFSIFDLNRFEEIYSKSDFGYYPLKLALIGDELIFEMEDFEENDAASYSSFNTKTLDFSQANPKKFRNARAIDSIEDYKNYVVFCDCHLSEN
jgi:hypothetical protein